MCISISVAWRRLSSRFRAEPRDATKPYRQACLVDDPKTQSFRSFAARMRAAAPTGTIAMIFTSFAIRSEEHTSELQSLAYLVCRLLLEKKKKEQRHTTLV